MKKTAEERKAARKARMETALAALKDDAIETVEDFVGSGFAGTLEGCLPEVEELQAIPSLQNPAERCVRAIRVLLAALKSVPDERAETWAERNLPPPD